jgi:DNA recombination protein Rad52
MSFSAEQLASLTAPLGKSHIRSRSQAGRTLSYVEGWWAIAEANRIFGFDAWDRETVDLRQLGEAYQDAKSLYRVAYMAKVRITVRADGRATMVVRDGCGYGSGIDRDLGSAHESAIKEAETDAMKRALMTFGNPFGLALYDKEQRNVEDDTAPPPKPPTKHIATTVIDEIMMTPTNDQEELFRVLTKAITDCKTLEKLAQTKEAATESLKALTDAQYADFKKVYQFKKKALETFGAAAA